MKEKWKCYSEFSLKYLVSDKGNVKVIIDDTEQILKQYTAKRKNSGYPMVYLLSKTGKWGPNAVHRLVAELFIPNSNNLPIINHKDENKLNNNADNLEWCENDYNQNYGTRNERISKALTGRKLSDETKHKMSEAKKGHTVIMTNEWKKKISEANKGKSRNKGIKRSPEHRKKLSEAMKKKWASKKV